MSDIAEQLRQIRAEAAALLVDLSATEPDRPADAESEHDGAVWTPALRWKVHAIRQEHGYVFVETPTYWGSGDLDCLTAEEAVRLALSLLAAARWNADELAQRRKP
jgi:hypothetical protein